MSFCLSGTLRLGRERGRALTYRRKGYATMQSDGYQAADVIPAVNAALQSNGLVDVGISCCEGQGWSMQRKLLEEIQDAGAEGGLQLISTHTYKGDPPRPDSPFNTTLPVWVTEISPIMDRLGMTQTWYRNHSENEGLLHAINIHEALTTGNVSAYIYWIGAGQSSAEAPFIWAPNPKKNVSGQDMWKANDNTTVVEIPAGKAAYTIGSTYWASAHFSRFIRPGAQRIEARAGWFFEDEPRHPALLASAFRNNNGSIVVQVINNGDEKLEVYLGLALRNRWSNQSDDCKIDTWVTDSEMKFQRIDAAVLEAFRPTGNYTLSARSLTTFVVNCGAEV